MGEPFWMRAGTASRTAELMALFRVMESARPRGRLFEDPFAPLCLKPPLRLLYQLSRVGMFRGLVESTIDAVIPGARSSGIARTRFIDDELRSALESGCRQVVIAGAGFDCRAYPGAMAQSGYDARCLMCFIWEGVTNYLTGPAIDATFRWFAAAAPGSRVIFTYVHRRMLDAPAAFYGAERLFHQVRRLNEPWAFGFDPRRAGSLSGRSAPGAGRGPRSERVPRPIPAGRRRSSRLRVLPRGRGPRGAKRPSSVTAAQPRTFHQTSPRSSKTLSPSVC